ncbi:MAG: DUF2264 domain-containing protein [Propionibacteriaceae bacterium]|nr:DUF2264 domain-containing protein [Propionibacteriaceae bacterium]
MRDSRTVDPQAPHAHAQPVPRPHHTPSPLDPGSLDWAMSPHTGWIRQTWSTMAERMVAAAQRHASPNHPLIEFPGGPGGYGADINHLEGFARTFLAAGFLAAGDPTQRAGLDWWAEGLRHGADPTKPAQERWVRPHEHDQAKVEACSLALILHLTRDYLWSNLDGSTQELLVDYLAELVHASRPANNWVWFRLIVEQFLKSVGGPWSIDDQAEDLDFSDSCHVADGWYRDGAGRTFDHYCGWVFQVYPLLWCDMMPNDPASRAWRTTFQTRLDHYLADAIHLIGADGAVLAQGRSLIYRFAAAAPSGWARGAAHPPWPPALCAAPPQGFCATSSNTARPIPTACCRSAGPPARSGPTGSIPIRARSATAAGTSAPPLSPAR